MYYLLFICLIIGYFISLFISTITIIHIIRNQEKYGTFITSFLNVSTIVLAGFIYSTFYVFSIIIYYSQLVNITLWKLSLIFGFVSCGIMGLIYAFIKEYKEIPFFPLLIYTILFGLLIGSIFYPDSIQIIYKSSKSPPNFLTDTSDINYIFNNITGLLTAIFLIFILIYYIYIAIILYIKARNKKLSLGVILNTIIFIIPILMYIFYIFFQLTIFRELHIIILWIYLSGICIMLIKKPEMFLALTNKIYSLNIYHKSGILLFSYEFENVKELNDSPTWGNILIGINHILSEFIDKKDQIEVIETKSTKIVVNYNNEYGFAVLVITNQKNAILANYMENFMNGFKNRYKNELIEIQDLNKIINVSEFEDTKEIIEENFKIYL